MASLISIIIPVYNEEKNIPLVHQAVTEEMVRLKNFSYEIIFINDGSTDASQTALDVLATQDKHVKVIEFSRNFGKEVATTAGLEYAAGDAAIMLDADMQHPVELIPTLVSRWQAGADTVIGVREKNKGEGLLKKVGSSAFYYSMNLIADTDMASRATDFRLVNRQVIEAFKQCTEHQRITRGILDWLGFKKEYVYFKANARTNGEASYSPAKLLHLAMAALISHSMFPLRFAGYLGALIIIFSSVLGSFIVVDKYIINDPFHFAFTGTAILAVINLFLAGIMLGCLGLIALYIGNIHHEVVNRPMYIVRSTKNMNR